MMRVLCEAILGHSILVKLFSKQTSRERQ